jgi:hypothetical protein
MRSRRHAANVKGAVGLKRLILHVGPHKTASTYLQYRLLKARAGLTAHGVTYPEFGISQFAHHRIVEHLRDNRQAAGDVTDETISQHLSKLSTVILSSEEFIYLNAGQLTRLRSLLPDFSFEVIFYFRTPVDLLPSHWQELVKHGWDVTLLEYLAAFTGWTKVFDTRTMNPVAQVTRLGQVFNAEDIRIICYNNLVAEQTDVFDHFWMHVLGLPRPPPVGEQRNINPSLPLERIDLLRNLNELYRQRVERDPNTKILEAYLAQQSVIEAAPGFEGYCEAFRRYAPDVLLSSSQEMFRMREQTLLDRFGHRIENKAAPNRIFIREEFSRAIKSAPRYWIDRFGQAEYVNGIYDMLLSSRSAEK